MIEISHQQAQRTLRDSLDRPVPDTQWAALQSHLEMCAECRAYRAEVQTLERSLSRALRLRWEGTSAVQPIYAGRLLARRRRQRLIRQRAWLGGAVLLALLVFWFFGGFEWLPEAVAGLRREQARRASASLPPVPRPAALPSVFSAPVLFSEWVDGKSDLYLVTPDGELSNLTAQPGKTAVDYTDPAWSPDGEWYAYLATLTGKQELYVSGFPDGAALQLTSAPGIDWTGPLSWSPDGRWIALTGVRREQGGQQWVYLVPLDGSSGPRALAGTRGGWAPEFSPKGSQLAFVIGEGAGARAAVFTFEQNESFAGVENEIHWTGPSVQGVRVRPGVIQFEPDRANARPAESSPGGWSIFRSGFGLDWSPDGAALVYIAPASAGGGARVLIQHQMDYTTSLYDDYKLVSYAAESSWLEDYRAVTWTGSGAVAFLEDQSDARANPLPAAALGCWSLQTRRSSGRAEEAPRLILGGLCVDGGLDRSNWSPDQGWLVLVGRNAGESRRGLYAVRVAGGGQAATPVAGTLVRLLDPGDFLGAEVQPRVRPQGAALGIRPRPARAGQAALPPSDLRLASGKVAFALRNNAVTVIASASPDGTRGRVLTVSDGNNRCPRFSPDGEQMVFISDSPYWQDSGTAGVQLGSGGGGDLPANGQQIVYLLGSGGAAPQPLSGVHSFPAPPGLRAEGEPMFGCPVWSPDGQYVAAAVAFARANFLAVLPLPEARSAGARMLVLPLASPVRGFSWTADSRRLVLAQEDPARRQPQFLIAALPAAPGGELSAESFTPPFDLGVIGGMAVSPDGEQVYVFSAESAGALSPLAVLRELTLDGWQEGAHQALGLDAVVSAAAPDALAWLSRSGLGMIVHGGAQEQVKSVILRYDLARARLETLAQFEDRIYNAAWSADGSWVIFSAESGLWALDLNRARLGAAAPVWISPQPVEDLDWAP